MAPVLLLVVTLPLFGAKAKHSSRPPTDLHRVGDHWTAYNPPDPSTYAPNAKTYTIKSGDTLWALAKQFYGNAYLWPQLWESNTWVTDAHWIYPGDTLLVEGEASNKTAETTTTTSVSGDTTAMQPNTSNTPLPTVSVNTAAAAPAALGAEADLYCWGYLGASNEPMPNEVESFEDTEMLYQQGVVEQSMSVRDGDVVFIKGGSATGLVAGDTYLLVQPGDLVTHPTKNTTLGRHYDYVGQVRILCTDANRATAIVTQACREIYIGTKLKPLPQLPIPIARVPELPTICDSPSNQRGGYIVNSKGWESGLAVSDLVEIDLGRDDQVQPGDVLTVYRDSPVPGQPRQVLGEIGVLTTESHTATARVVAMRLTMIVGDKIEMR
ncbi:MAG TPA: LysM peptidoglycan-binding domain-containing protein [Thermoanaerobaculia bacterium]